MTFKLEEFVGQYVVERPRYERLTNRVESLLKELIEPFHLKVTVEARTKAIDSFREKVTRPEKSYTDPLNQITDLCGIRIIGYSLKDVETVADLIRNEFHVDAERSVNKADLLDPDRFGYLSQQYIVKLHKKRGSLAEWRDLADLWAEIQVRTVLQHAWAVVDHSLVYKTEQDVPRELRRRLSRVMALFELADQELDSLISERKNRIEEYKTDVDENRLGIELNLDSLRSYIMNSPEVKYWQNFCRKEVGINVDDNDWNNLPRTVRIIKTWDIHTIEQLDTVMRNARGWGENLFLKYYEAQDQAHSAVPGASRSRVTQVTDTAVLFIVIATFIDKIVAENLEMSYRFGVPDLVKVAREVRGI